MNDTAVDVFREFLLAGLWPGVGSTRAQRLLEWEIDRPEAVSVDALLAVPKITRRTAVKLYNAWQEVAPLYQLAEIFVPHQFPLYWVRRIAQTFPEMDAQGLSNNPWLLLTIPGCRPADSDRLARLLIGDFAPTDVRRVRGLLLHIVLREARRGHTVSNVRQVERWLTEFGVRERSATVAGIDAGLASEELMTFPDPAGGATGDGRELAPWGLGTAEVAIAADIVRLQQSQQQLWQQHGAKVAADLDQEQCEAVGAAGASGLSVLTGGPGTGKSRTVGAIWQLCQDLGLTILLAAPTGRAAKRMSELSGSGEAVTIHRLLGARRLPDESGSSFSHNRDFPLEADIIIIDEVSMLDVELAAALLAAVPDGTHMVWVGDLAQLPPIGPGQVLRDVLAANVCPVTTLTTLYRQESGGQIARLAQSMRHGELIAPARDVREAVIVPADNSAIAAKRVQQLVLDSIPRTFQLDITDIQVITPIHRGPAGTVALNAALKEALNPGPGRLRGFDIGDRVVATANHFDALPVGFANGEVGTVTEVSSTTLTVTFDDGAAEVRGKDLADLTHGWAMTVHRAQGSQWPAVVVVLPPEAERMLSRPLIYTAITRAEQHLSVVHAAGAAVARAVAVRGVEQRRTRLQKLLTDN